MEIPRPVISEKAAAAPKPSTCAMNPLPAIVVTRLSGEIMRTRLSEAVKRLPLRSATRLAGDVNVALVPVASL